MVVPLARAASRSGAPAWAEGPQGPPATVGRLLFGEALDPNRASAEDLTVLPGIGPARAAAIVAAREARPFCEAADLMRAHGLGPKTVARLRSWLSFDPPPVACPSEARG